MTQKGIGILLGITLLITVGACAKKAPTWQEQYDLGMRYLSEGNYEEAIIAFSAAIEIDSKLAPTYVGRGQAYVFSGETEENLIAAQADFETAIELNEVLAEAWLGLADIFIRRGEYDKALEILRQGIEKTNSAQGIVDKITEIESGNYIDLSGNVRLSYEYTPEGDMLGYSEYFYDELGRLGSWDIYSFRAERSDEIYSTARFVQRGEAIYNAQNRPESYQFYDIEGVLTDYETFVYDNDLMTEAHQYRADGSEVYYHLVYYDEQGREERSEGYGPDGKLDVYWISAYDEGGEIISKVAYYPDGTIAGYESFE